MEPNDRIVPINIEDEMKSSYIDYSMSVIVSRALPDVRDGLKPVHRRVLFGMSELDVWANRPYKKSARIVGEVLGKYHPHGDTAVYDTMVRLAQDFSMRHPLVDGQGNFGSVDGDSAAAMRYTEARLTKVSEELLRDLKKGTVDYRPNFDDSLKEPIVLPAAVPNLLVNGASGIAVGMATNIPPHNLAESVNACIAYIDDNEITIEGLMEHLSAPDFPTGGIIFGYKGVRDAYHTGRGRVIMRAKMHEEVLRGTRNALIVTEIPYQVNKSKLIEKMADLVRDKRIEGIYDLRDESDRNGMRVVIELKKDAVPMVIQNLLYKYTQLQQTFGVNMVALVNGRPKLLNLQEVVSHYINHRHEIVTRRTQFELNKAEARAHILEGLLVALDHLDAVISIIRYSETVDDARSNLMMGAFPSSLTAEIRAKLELPAGDGQLFTLTEDQAKAILDLKLSRLTGLERKKIENEYTELMTIIEDLRDILANEGRRMTIIKEELIVVRDKYTQPRRSEIDYMGGGEIDMEDIIPNEQVVVTITSQGLVKRTQIDAYRQQRRGGVGLRGTGTRSEDYVENLFVSSTHDWLMFFTDHGQCYWLRVYNIPEGQRTNKGRSVRNLIQIDQEDRVKAIINVKKDDFKDEDFLNSHYVLMATRRGKVKKTSLAAFRRPRSNGIIAIVINEGDELFEAHLTTGESEVVLAASSGHAIRFSETQARPLGRKSQGVRGMRLREGHQIVGMIVVDSDERSVMSISENGYGKRSNLNDYRLQSRGGKGVITMKTTDKTGNLVSIKGVLPTDDLMIVTSSAMMIRMSVSGIREMGRNTQGVRLINLKSEDSIADVTRLVIEDKDEEAETVEGAEGIENPETDDATESTDSTEETSSDE